jgi:hypothetical protein
MARGGAASLAADSGGHDVETTVAAEVGPA